MKSIRHESTEQQQHLFSIAAIMAKTVVGQQQLQQHQQQQIQSNSKSHLKLL